MSSKSDISVSDELRDKLAEYFGISEEDIIEIILKEHNYPTIKGKKAPHILAEIYYYNEAGDEVCDKHEWTEEEFDELFDDHTDDEKNESCGENSNDEESVSSGESDKQEEC